VFDCDARRCSETSVWNTSGGEPYRRRERSEATFLALAMQPSTHELDSCVRMQRPQPLLGYNCCPLQVCLSVCLSVSADRINGRAYATVLPPTVVVCLSVRNVLWLNGAS